MTATKDMAEIARQTTDGVGAAPARMDARMDASVERFCDVIASNEVLADVLDRARELALPVALRGGDREAERGGGW